MTPLHLACFPMVGPTGDRDNVERLLLATAALLPAGSVLELDVVHDAGCPCEDGTHPLPACTCVTVDLVLSSVDERITA